MYKYKNNILLLDVAVQIEKCGSWIMRVRVRVRVRVVLGCLSDKEDRFKAFLEENNNCILYKPFNKQNDKLTN